MTSLYIQPHSPAMNKTLRQAYLANSWSRPEGFLAYLREQKCFSHSNGDTKANPYWYGSILEFNTLDRVAGEALASKSISKKRLAEFAETYTREDLSPIVRLTGYVLQRLLKVS